MKDTSGYLNPCVQLRRARGANGHTGPLSARLLLVAAIALGTLLTACGSHTFAFSGQKNVQVSSNGGSVVVHGSNGSGSYSVGNQLPHDYPATQAPLPSGAKVLSVVGGSEGSGTRWGVTSAVPGPVDSAANGYQHRLSSYGYTISQVNHALLGGETVATFLATSSLWTITTQVSSNGGASGSSAIPAGDVMCTIEVAPTTKS